MKTAALKKTLSYGMEQISMDTYSAQFDTSAGVQPTGKNHAFLDLAPQHRDEEMAWVKATVDGNDAYVVFLHPEKANGLQSEGHYKLENAFRQESSAANGTPVYITNGVKKVDHTIHVQATILSTKNGNIELHDIRSYGHMPTDILASHFLKTAEKVQKGIKEGQTYMMELKPEHTDSDVKKVQYSGETPSFYYTLMDAPTPVNDA